MKKKLKKRLNIIDNFQNKNLLVIGDSILDVSVYSKAIGLSLETPTIKAKEEKTDYSFGGAGNVVKNILELGAKCSFITLLGEDSDAEFYKRFQHPNFKLFPLIEKDRKTTVKKRFWIERSGHNYKIFQLDKLDNSPIKQESEEKTIKLLRNNIQNYDLILLVDYRHGMMSKSLIKSIKEIALNKKPVIASSQVSESLANHRDYSGVDLICMNQEEAKAIWPDFKTTKISELESSLDSGVCITMSKHGSIMSLNHNVYSSKGIKTNEVDSCGAGDYFLAALSLSDLTKPEDSLYIANCWAGLSVKKLRTIHPKKQELLDYIKNER